MSHGAPPGSQACGIDDPEMKLKALVHVYHSYQLLEAHELAIDSDASIGDPALQFIVRKLQIVAFPAQVSRGQLAPDGLPQPSQGQERVRFRHRGELVPPLFVHGLDRAQLGLGVGRDEVDDGLA